ncbi:MMPL family transporter [Micromonospora sp. WMMA1363]|uniref:MMPL family transporter n=1 Tax=Micromonospora sp. WMMA1363 TaxID=3053985 RepID=UPI00259D2720|nr:MMPL family transporter [Micromonospora sp. WMMA1363]MDM4722529.1 MMPL family transporter [Micromonospora sp. WMMA1363]
MTRVGSLAVRHPWAVIAAWLVAAALVAAAVVGFGRPTAEDVVVPGSAGQTGRELLDEHFAGAGDATGRIILRVDSGRLDDAANAAAISAAAADVTDVAHVVEVTPPGTGTISADGRTGYVTVRFDLGPRDVTPQLADEVIDAAGDLRDAGIETVPGGALAVPRAETRTSELLGLGVAAIVMILAFGGLVAAGLPLITALITLVCGVGLIGLAGHLTGMPSVAGTLATMIGLGVGIDYALFIITRYRDLLAERNEPGPAIVAAIGTSGSAVLFAGGTVVVALGGLAIAGVPILATLGWTAGLVVLLAVAAATTLLPALLAVLGHRVNALRVVSRRDRGLDRSGWGRLAGRVIRRPGRYAVGTAVLLAALAAPAAGLQLGQTDPGDEPPGSPARTGYDLMAEGFGPGANGPLTVVAELDHPAAGPDDARLTELSQLVTGTAGVAVVQPVRLSADGELASLQVQPATAPSDPATVDTVRALRSTTVDGMSVHVTGQTAIRADLGDRVSERMPWVIATVVALSAVLLLFAFRAPVLALKAAVMNLLSVGAAYGALTAVFSWGWGVGLTGLDGPVPVEAYVPMMLFALLFGLSMDYEVFLLTAVRESWLATGDNRQAVRTGLAATGRVITSAALIMVCVFASFVLNPNPVVKMFGLGMAVAIAVDATIIRGLLVPATMALLGRANWWMPRRRRAGVTSAAGLTGGAFSDRPVESRRPQDHDSASDPEVLSHHSALPSPPAAPDVYP